MNKLEKLKQQKKADSDIPKLMSWLAFIGEKDPVCIAEVVEQFKADSGAREYYLSRHREVFEPEPTIFDQAYRATNAANEHNTTTVFI